MKATIVVLFLSALNMTARSQDKAALNEVISVFDEIDAHFKEWTHYSYGADNPEGGRSYQHQVWKNDSDAGFVKVEMLNVNEHGETKVQYYFKGGRLFFTLDRAETALMIPRAPTDVVEKRYYFANNQLIRLLEKKGRFAEGTKADTTAIKNRELPVNAQEESAGETYTTQHKLAGAVLERVRKLEEEPAVHETGVSRTTIAGDGWRTIAGSGSRDGDYALAWGLKGKKVSGGEAGADGFMSVDNNDPDLANYVVDLHSKAIVGILQGKHFGDRQRYNHITNETEWSSDSMYVAQVCSFKWHTSSAFVYELRRGMSVSPGVDLIAPATTAAFKKLKGGPQLKKFKPGDFAITLNEVRIMQSAAAYVLMVNVLGQVPKNNDDEAFFECKISFSLTSGENNGSPGLKCLSTELLAD